MTNQSFSGGTVPLQHNNFWEKIRPSRLNTLFSVRRKGNYREGKKAEMGKTQKPSSLLNDWKSFLQHLSSLLISCQSHLCFLFFIPTIEEVFFHQLSLLTCDLKSAEQIHEVHEGFHRFYSVRKCNFEDESA